MYPFPKLLSQNSDLRRSGIFNWTLPAFVVELSDGSKFNACPHAGPCARVCYARFGTYNFSNVKARHVANLEYTLNQGDLWEEQMTKEISGRRFEPSMNPHNLEFDRTDPFLTRWVLAGGRAVRIHDSGDFYDRRYFERWMRIAEKRPHVLFYAYTKEVSMLKPLVDWLPENMRLIFSTGGLEDALIDRENDRHAEVFPDLGSLEAAGYFDQADNDVLAAVAPSNKIGIVQNNIPAAKKRFDGRTMSELHPNARKP